MPQSNVLWIVADHQALANRAIDPGLFPLQDWLRGAGVEFTRAYTVLPICSPARASMLTGKYPHTHGLTENDGRFGGRSELDGSDKMVQHDFAAAGYHCGWFGKWHLSQSLSACDFGFNGFSQPGYGYPYNTPEYLSYLERFHQGPLWAEVECPGESRRHPGDLIDMTAETAWFDYEAGTARLNGVEGVHEAHFLADAAIKWLQDLKGSPDEHPFFLRVDAWGPHPPYTIPTGFDSPLGEVPNPDNLAHDLCSRPQHHRDYRDQWRKDLPPESFDWALLSQRVIEHCILVERALLRIVTYLEATEQLENTIVLFCADHGDAVASNGGVMNKGSLMVEETMRIPLLVAGHGVAQGQRCDHLICNVDLAPTLYDMCKVPKRHAMDGRSVIEALADPSSTPVRQRLMTQHYGLHVPILQRALYQGRWKYVIQPDGFEELYDLIDDPSEMTNLANCPCYVSQLGLMRQGLNAEMQLLGDDDPRLDLMRKVLNSALT